MVEGIEPKDKSIKARFKRLVHWCKTNPLKVAIICLCIINLALIICIPIKDHQIKTYPEKIEIQQAILDGRRIRSADMTAWVKSNETRYARIKANGEYMITELLN